MAKGGQSKGVNVYTKMVRAIDFVEMVVEFESLPIQIKELFPFFIFDAKREYKHLM